MWFFILRDMGSFFLIELTIGLLPVLFTNLPNAKQNLVERIYFFIVISVVKHKSVNSN
jgi:hypothetical protein